MRSAPLGLLLLLTAGCESLPEMVTTPPWSARFGDEGDQAVLVTAVDRGGDTALTGTYTGVIDLGGGPLARDFVSSTFVAVLDAYGHHRWSVPVVGGFVLARGIAHAPDGWVFTAAYSDRTSVAGTVVDAFGDDLLVAMFDAAGKPRWIKHWGADDGGPSGVGSSDPTAGVAVDARGDIVVAGYFSGTLGFGGSFLEAPHAPTTAFIAKLDSEGRERWATSYGETAESMSPTSMALDPGGDIIIAGNRKRWSGTDAFVARFDEHGKLRHDLFFEGPGTSSVQGVAVDPHGDVILSGFQEGNVKVGGFQLPAKSVRGFVAALSAGGKVQWARSLGDDDVTAFTVAAGVVADDTGLIVSGSYSGPLQDFPVRPSLNVPSGFVAELGFDGQVGRYQILSPTTGDTSGPPLLAISGGDLILSGGFQGDLTRAGATLQSAGGRDAFISRAPRQ